MFELLLTNLKHDSPEGPPGVEFLGEVGVTGFIDGEELASAIGLTRGIAQHTTEPWLHFVLDGVELYVAKRTYRHTLSWNHINAVGAVFGTKTVVINGKTYKVRLLKGANTDPTPNGGSNVGDPRNTWGSEWNRLLYPLIPNPSSKPASGISGEGLTFGGWANYSEADLVVHSSGGFGSYSWCQESSDNTRVLRGYHGVSNFILTRASYADSSVGWRPVLELVG